MEKEIHQMLLEADDFLPQGEYLSSHFDYQAAMSEVRALAADLTALGYEIQLDNNVQNATFFTDLWCGSQAFGIRFSGSGRLVLISTGGIRGHESVGLPAEVLELLQQRRYKIVRPEQLAGALYDGAANHFATKLTWFERYFDYL